MSGEKARKNEGRTASRIRNKLKQLLTTLKKNTVKIYIIIVSIIFSYYIYFILNIVALFIYVKTPLLGILLFSLGLLSFIPYLGGLSKLFETIHELKQRLVAVVLGTLFYGLVIMGIAVLLVEPTDEQSFNVFLTMLNESRFIILAPILGVIITLVVLTWYGLRGASNVFLFLSFITSLILLYLHGVVLYNVVPTKLELADLHHVNKSNITVTNMKKINITITNINKTLELAKRTYQTFKESMEIIGIMLTIAASVATYVLTKKDREAGSS